MIDVAESTEPEEHQELIAAPRSPKKRSLFPEWLIRPIRIWRDKIQQDKCCPKTKVKEEALSSSFWLTVGNVTLGAYLLVGAIAFNLRHTSTYETASFLDNFLFCVTTLSTIGYGNIVPHDGRGKLSCVLYCFTGIPLFFTILAANSCVFVDFCNILYQSFTGKEPSTVGIRWYTAAFLLVLHCSTGSLIFSFWIDELDVLDAFYFSFISITTIGYGDFSPTPEGPFQYFVVMIYLSTGVAVMLLFFSSLQKGIMWIHYFGRKVSDSEEAEIWFGGKMMTVKDLVNVVAKRFGSTPEKLRDVLHQLDVILEVACQQTDESVFEEECALIQSPPIGSPTSPAPRKKTIFLSSSSDGPDADQATIHSFSSTNQRSIPKDTELAILALGTIQHHLRKPSVRAKAGHPRTPPVTPKGITKPSSDTAIEQRCTALDLRKMAHRVHSDGRLLTPDDV